jgi:iron complex outermembrane recepter protein
MGTDAMRRRESPLIFFIGILLLVCILGEKVFCQDVAAPGKLDASDKSDANSQAEKLDKLLRLAEKDIGQLSQVRVSGQTGSPSLDTPVSTVSRQPTTIGQMAAAVYVVTHEMIRRSGAKTVPDVLRMVPGVDVAQINANTWAISIRGFNAGFANKLLVMIDGRTIYTPMFAGVYWSEQDVLLEDVERIEVIRGPGASVWGANAVNGIINIVTKNSKDTQGAYLESGAGTEQLGFTSMRFGGGNGDDLHYRFYGKWFERGSTESMDQYPAWDDWHQTRGGFRMDWEASEDNKFTFQGDCYNGYSNDKTKEVQWTSPFSRTFKETVHQEGENALLRWTHTIDKDSDWATQVYYDRMEHRLINRQLVEDHDVFDFDFQHRFPIGEWNEWIWGTGYRTTRDRGSDTPTWAIIPPSRNYKLISYFVQDRMTLEEDKWFLTLGCKFEHNDFTNFEYQPTVRLLWEVDHKHSIWGAVSRAVRTPARGELNGFVIGTPFMYFGPFPVSQEYHGNPLLQSEDLIAYELGYREQTTEKLSWDATVFLNDYRHLQCWQWNNPYFDWNKGFFFWPNKFVNGLSGKSYGIELSGNYEINPRWKLQGSYSFLIVELNPLTYPLGEWGLEGTAPRSQFYLQSSWDLGKKWELDLIGRYADTVATYAIPSYFVGDVRLAWKPNKNFEWSIVGRNLLDGSHPEFGDEYIYTTIHTEVQQEVYTQIIWRH